MGDGRVHARAHAMANALCGARPDGGNGTRKEREITCLLCIDEVTRRRAKLVHFRRPRESILCGRGSNGSSLWAAVTCPRCLQMKATAWIPPSRH